MESSHKMEKINQMVKLLKKSNCQECCQGLTTNIGITNPRDSIER